MPVALVFLELLFVTALATFFSTFSTPIMSVLFTLSLFPLWLAPGMAQTATSQERPDMVASTL